MSNKLLSLSFITFAYSLVLTVGSNAAASISPMLNYNVALEKSLLFFEAQRSGKLPADQRVKWRGDSGLTDGFLQGVDLVGGYYDSGDHVKFGLPMAYSMTMLSWSMIQFEKEITASNQLEYTLDAIRWGTDYLIKAHKQPNTLWSQVGEGESDHYCWERAEDMNTPRNAHKVDVENPGSDIAGETAAALAAASIAFRPYDSSYSKLLLSHAKQLFSFADTFRGRYDVSIPSVKDFYPSSTGYYDELLWASAWLFEATDDKSYLNYVIDNSASFGGTGWAVKEFSWDNKYAGLQVLLTKVLMQEESSANNATLRQYKAKADFFLCACLQKNNGYNVEMTSGGLLYFNEWNNMQYVSAASFLLAVYSDYLSMAKASLHCPDGEIEPLALLKFAQSQGEYMLGKNPKSMSYLVGNGAKYPTQVHHRGASIASKHTLPTPVGCTEGFQKWFNNMGSNPNVLTGALVGGPNMKDEFLDKRFAYEQTEPSLSGNAPLVGLFAKLGSMHIEVNKTGYLSEDSKPTHESGTVPVEFLHSITKTWMVNRENYYRHKVTVMNKSGKTLTSLKLRIENLSGEIWGLARTQEKRLYELPSWLKVVKPGEHFSFVYVQGGPQAKVSLASYT